MFVGDPAPFPDELCATKPSAVADLASVSKNTGADRVGSVVTNLLCSPLVKVTGLPGLQVVLQYRDKIPQLVSRVSW